MSTTTSGCRTLIREAIATTSLLGALACTALAIVGWSSLAIATAIGTLFGAINFVLLARAVGGAIDRTVAGVERARRELDATHDPREGLEPADVVGRPLGAGGGFRLALFVVLVAALFLLLPIDPAGIAIGIVITLVGASLAAHRLERARRSPH